MLEDENMRSAHDRSKSKSYESGKEEISCEIFTITNHDTEKSPDFSRNYSLYCVHATEHPKLEFQVK